MSMAEPRLRIFYYVTYGDTYGDITKAGKVPLAVTAVTFILSIIGLHVISSPSIIAQFSYPCTIVDIKYTVCLHSSDLLT